MIKNSNDNGTAEWLAQSNTLLGENTIKVAEELGIGSQDYNLINVDEESSNLGLYITLGVVAVILVIAVGFLIFYIIKKKKNENVIVKINEFNRLK